MKSRAGRGYRTLVVRVHGTKRSHYSGLRFDAYSVGMERSRLLVAVVDDEETVRRALLRMLRTSQIDAVAYGSGQEFLDSLPSCVPDCVVLDLQMAGLTGHDVQQLLTRRAEPIPVVILTAHDSPEARARCLRDGAAAYLCKPLRCERLIEAINGAVRNTI
jgi:FixJ family two-component response regulator